MIRYLLRLTIVFFILSMIFISCGPIKKDLSYDSEEKGYIRFVSDYNILPANYSTPMFRLSYYYPSGERWELWGFCCEEGAILTLPPGTHSFQVQPYQQGKWFKVTATAVKDKIVTINCYTIESSRKQNMTMTTTTTTIRYKFGYRKSGYAPYP